MDNKCELHAQDIAENRANIKALFKKQDEITKLSDSVKELALSVREMVVRLGDVEGRLGTIEEEKRGARKTVWACVVTGVLGALVSYVMSILLHQ